ncbi:NEURL4 [Branchiostoma lanceolatum]|uniref:NEURL4 protein n=1 Tax=Branchiostoma lanceolatum TaxID=7740 RepID=A0A8J9ZBS2_BRALA|nr:NEURL4 [Branchiostoma lanceolatum]
MDRTQKSSARKESVSSKIRKPSTTTSKADSPRKPSTTSKADSPRKPSTTTSKADSPRKPSTTTSKVDSPRKPSTTSKSESPRKPSTTSKSESPRKPSTTTKADSPSKLLTTSKHDSPSKLSTPSKADSPRKLSTTNKAPTRKPSRKESVHHEEEEDEEEEAGWTEAYLRAQMKDTDSSKELDLSNKSLEEIPPDVFSIKEVEVLDASDNPIESIPVNVASLSSLKEMRAAGCDLREVSGNISRCTYLGKIDFSRNPHIGTLPATMKQLAYLKYVALSGCELKSLPKNLTLLATIETLDLSKNAMTTLPSDISGLKRMKVLILNDNAFRTIPEAIKSLGRLNCLEMKRNKLNNHEGDLVLNVPSKLKILDMEDNCSLALVPDGLGNLEAIEGVNFSYCGIETLSDSIGQISTLKEIHIAGNKLRSLPDSFGRLLNLETLDLEGNRRLTSLPLTLHHLRKLKDKETGTNTGLVMDNVPTMDIPEPKIVKEGVVSILSELLAEDSINSVTGNIAAEVVDDTIIEHLSDDIVTIVEGGLSDDLMLYMTDVAIVEEECAKDIFTSTFEKVIQDLLKEVSKETADEDKVIFLIVDELVEEMKTSMAKDEATSAVRLDAVAWGVMEELLKEKSDATAKSVALEQEEEWRLGQTVPEEYDTQFSYEVSSTSATVQSVDLPAGCNLSIPPGATDEDTSVISAVLNPHGYEGALPLEDNELLVSDIVEMLPAGMTFSKPVKLKIPHSLPKFDKEREYVVMTSENDGMTWETLRTLSHQEKGQAYVIVEVAHFSSFAVVARPYEHCHRVRKGEASELKSSKQTEIKVVLPKDCVPSEEEISFKVIPVDKETLACAGMEDSGMGDINRMSHIVKFFKGSNLLLNRPATIVLPLSPGKEDSKVRVLSCNESGNWEDVTDKVDDVVLKESKVAFKTDRLSSGFTVLRSDKIIDPNEIVALVAKNTRARRVRTVIFKKWKEPREEGIMTARMECVLEEMVEDRICFATKMEEYEKQEGTPTPTMSMMEGETFCAMFRGSIRPNVEEINTLYGVNFTFYCHRPRMTKFDVTLVDKGKYATSTVKFYPGRREIYHPCAPGEEGATPLATAEITAPTGIICDYWLACQRFKNTLGIADTYLSPDHNMCFCKTCHTDRGESDSYSRGNPKKKYAVPVGWGRFGLNTNKVSEDKEVNVFANWHRAYHGTVPNVVKKILQTSQLLMPGDTALGGIHLGEREGHFNEKRKPEGFDTQQVYLSPSIEYSGDDAYAYPTWFKDNHDETEYAARVAFQVCVRPNSYKVGPETIGARREGRTIDPLFSNDELEWFTKERGGHVLYGLLVKLEEL